MILDACILIAALDRTDHHHAAATEVLTGDDDFVIHPLNLAEVLVGPARAGRLPAARRLVEALFVEEATTSAGEGARLAVVRATTGLGLPDCCVIALAQAREEGTIATVDARLASAARGLGFDVRP